ncbi:hypothetical protein [Rubinisphaera margarita]|uniref:hypothetical protein n=1 Tax=Rubinisphaera margarita TaxID=2909586 RepID=UPI001EE8E99F|nr:hypothetical protein [Rubinisphaera margarita]MCG6157640.1 hypothetical protein [Rubinisphaera margarita]
MSHDNTPIHRIRLSTLSVAIFENRTDEGQVFYNTQFNRSYRSGDEWKQTRSFGKDDLLNLAKLCDLAHSWIHEQQVLRSEAAKTGEAA